MVVALLEVVFVVVTIHYRLSFAMEVLYPNQAGGAIEKSKFDF